MTSDTSEPTPTPWAAVMAEIRAELEAHPRLLSVGAFGSVVRGHAWERSDLDLFGVTAVDEARGGGQWDTVYLRRGGRLVHLQVLDADALADKLAGDRGTPFFAAMADVEPWFDREGHLARAIAYARRFQGHAYRACAELCAGAQALHLAEKSARAGHHDDARTGLAAALSQLARAELAAAGVFPPRDAWGEESVADLPEQALLSEAWTAEDTGPLIDRAWVLVRDRLRPRTAPIVTWLRERGPTPAEALVDAEPHAWGQLGERLLDELVAAGLLTEVTAPDAVFGLREVRYAAAPGV